MEVVLELTSAVAIRFTMIGSFTALWQIMDNNIHAGVKRGHFHLSRLVLLF